MDTDGDTELHGYGFWGYLWQYLRCSALIVTYFANINFYLKILDNLKNFDIMVSK